MILACSVALALELRDPPAGGRSQEALDGIVRQAMRLAASDSTADVGAEVRELLKGLGIAPTRAPAFTPLGAGSPAWLKIGGAEFSVFDNGSNLSGRSESCLLLSVGPALANSPSPRMSAKAEASCVLAGMRCQAAALEKEYDVFPQADRLLTTAEALVIESHHAISGGDHRLYPAILDVFPPAHWHSQRAIIIVWPNQLIRVILAPGADCSKEFSYGWILADEDHAQHLVPRTLPRPMEWVRRMWAAGWDVSARRAVGWEAMLDYSRKLHDRVPASERLSPCQLKGCECRHATVSDKVDLWGFVVDEVPLNFDILDSPPRKRLARLGATTDEASEALLKANDEVIPKSEHLVAKLEEIAKSGRLVFDPHTMEEAPEAPLSAQIAATAVIRHQLQVRGAPESFTSRGVLLAAINLGNRAIMAAGSPAALSVILRALHSAIGMHLLDPARVERLAIHTDEHTAKYLRSVANHGLNLQSHAPKNLAGTGRTMPSFGKAAVKIFEAMAQDYMNSAIVLIHPKACGTSAGDLLESGLGGVAKKVHGRVVAGEYRPIIGAHRSSNPWTSKYEFPFLVLPDTHGPLRRFLKLRALYPSIIGIQGLLRDIKGYFKRFPVAPESVKYVAVSVPAHSLQSQEGQGAPESVALPAFTAVSLVLQFGISGAPGASSPFSAAIATAVNSYRPPDPILNGPFNFEVHTWIDDSVSIEPDVGTVRQPLALALLEGAMRGLGGDAVSGKYRETYKDSLFYWGLEHRLSGDCPTVGISEGKLETAKLRLGNTAFDEGSRGVAVSELQGLYGALAHWCSTSNAGRALLTSVSALGQTGEPFVIPKGDDQTVRATWRRFWTAVGIFRDLIIRDDGRAFRISANSPGLGALSLEERLTLRNERDNMINLGGDAVPQFAAAINWDTGEYFLWSVSPEVVSLLTDLADAPERPPEEISVPAEEEEGLMIALYELLCLYALVCSYDKSGGQNWRCRSVHYISDNYNVVAWIVKRKPRNPVAIYIVASICSFELKGGFSLYASYAATESNVIADAMTRIPKRLPDGSLEHIDDLVAFLRDEGLSHLTRVDFMPAIMASLEPLGKLFATRYEHGQTKDAESLPTCAGPRAARAATPAPQAGTGVPPVIRVGEFAAGSGALSAAATELDANATVVYLSERAPMQRALLKQIFPAADLRCLVSDQENLDRVAPLDLLLGGPPCQVVSSANPRANGLSDIRAHVLPVGLNILGKCQRHLRMGSRDLIPSTLCVLEYVPNVLKHDDGSVWNQWIRWLKDADLVAQAFLMPASYYGDMTIRTRLAVVAQPRRLFEELGPMQPPIPSTKPPPPLVRALEAVEDMDPDLDVCLLSSPLFSPRLFGERGPYHHQRVGTFQEVGGKPQIVCSINHPAVTVRAWGDGTWHQENDWTSGGPGGSLYLDDRKGRGHIFALSHLAACRIQGVPLGPLLKFEPTTRGTPEWREWRKTVFEVAGNSVARGSSLAMVAVAMRHIHRARSRAKLYAGNPKGLPSYRAFVKWRNKVHTPTVPELSPAGGATPAPRRGDLRLTHAPLGGDPDHPSGADQGTVPGRAAPHDDTATASLGFNPSTFTALEPLWPIPERTATAPSRQHLGGRRSAKQIRSDLDGITPAAFESWLKMAPNIISHGLAPSTRNSYRKGWASFEDFCSRAETKYGPAFSETDPKEEVENTLIAFVVAEVHHHGNQGGSAANKLAAVVHYHKTHIGTDLVANSRRLPLVLAGLKRETGGAGNAKRPVRMLMLKTIRRTLTLDIFEHALAWGAVTLGFFFLLRVGNITGVDERALEDGDLTLCDSAGTPMDWSDPGVSIEEGDELVLIQRDSKTDRDKVGKALTQGRSGTDVCPVAAFIALIRARQQVGIQYEPQGKFLRRRGKPAVFSRLEVAALLQRTAVFMGEQPEDYGTHSLRKGGASALYAANVPLANIRQTGGWKSDSIFTYLWQSREVGRSLAAKMVSADDEDDALLVSLIRERRAAHST